jgi:hypothetical protein
MYGSSPAKKLSHACYVLLESNATISSQDTRAGAKVKYVKRDCFESRALLILGTVIGIDLKLD